MNDRCIIYVSRSIEPFDEVKLAALLLQSRQDNARMAITGVLLYLNGWIIQLLEGEQASLEDLYQRIKQDRRHTQITTLFDDSIEQRLFSSWSMGYETLTAHQLEELIVIVDLDKKLQTVSNTNGVAMLTLVKTFFDSHQNR